MKAFMLLMLICFTFSQAGAQGRNALKVKFISSVYQLGSEIPLKGAIVTTGDSTIQFIDRSLLKKKKLNSPELIQVIPIASISRFETKRKNGAGRGAWRGIVIGAAFGAILGYTTNNSDYYPEEGARIGAVLFSGPGFIVGSVAGAAINKTIKINGDPALYALKREKLKKYTLTGN
jgi:hypothetical protein